MKCPHCTIYFHDNWMQRDFLRDNQNFVVSGSHPDKIYWAYRSAHCPECTKVTIEMRPQDGSSKGLRPWRQIYPLGANRGPVPDEVPAHIADVYTQACNVLPISSMASAALSRLQTILHENGYKAKDLAKEIDALLNEADPKKALPHKLRETVDGIRNFGNFAAHPINDITQLQVIDVEDHEAEWCLEIVEDLFEHFYVGPALANEKKAQLNAKLKAAGKPPSK